MVTELTSLVTKVKQADWSAEPPEELTQARHCKVLGRIQNNQAVTPGWAMHNVIDPFWEMSSFLKLTCSAILQHSNADLRNLFKRKKNIHHKKTLYKSIKIESNS